LDGLSAVLYSDILKYYLYFLSIIGCLNLLMNLKYHLYKVVIPL